MNRSYLPVFKVITSCGGLALGKTTEEKRVRTGNKLMGQSKGNCLSITIISKTSFTREKITDCQSKLKCNYWFRLREIKEETLKVPLVHFSLFSASFPAPLPACPILILSLQHHWERGLQPISISSPPEPLFPHSFSFLQHGCSRGFRNTFSGAMDLLLLLVMLVFTPFLLFLRCSFVEAAPPWLRGSAMPCCPLGVWLELVQHGAALASHRGCPTAPTVRTRAPAL